MYFIFINRFAIHKNLFSIINIIFYIFSFHELIFINIDSKYFIFTKNLRIFITYLICQICFIFTFCSIHFHIFPLEISQPPSRMPLGNRYSVRVSPRLWNSRLPIFNLYHFMFIKLCLCVPLPGSGCQLRCMREMRCARTCIGICGTYVRCCYIFKFLYK